MNPCSLMHVQPASNLLLVLQCVLQTNFGHRLDAFGFDLLRCSISARFWHI